MNALLGGDAGDGDLIDDTIIKPLTTSKGPTPAYIGEIGWSMLSRSLEHMTLLKKKYSISPL